LTRIDAAAVDLVGHEVRDEVGESPSLPASTRGAISAAARPEPAAEVASAAAAPAAAAAAASGPRSATPAAPARASGPLICVAANAVDDVEMTVLLKALKQRARVPGALRVRIGDPGRFAT